MVKLAKNKDSINWLANLVIGFFKFQGLFTHITEVNHPDLNSCLYAMWHRNQCLVYGFHDRPGVSVLISNSGDGEVVARGIKHMGFKIVRGSKSRKGAVESTLQMIDDLKADRRVAIMVDGPHGPAEVVKDGIIKIAKLSGKPIVPVCWYSSNKNLFSLPTWDKLTMPVLNVNLINLYGEPIYVPEDASDEDIEKYRLEVENALKELDKKAPEEYNKVYWKGLFKRRRK